MALKYSSMLDLGAKIPSFELVNTIDGTLYSSSSLDNEKPSLIMVVCNHCPYVIHYHDELQRLARDFGSLIDFVAISSNNVNNYPQDGPQEMVVLFSRLGLDFPYLYDETQQVAKTLKAECTPEFYLYNGHNALVYRGRLDDSSPGNDIAISGKDLRMALNNLLAGQTIPGEQHPSVGCSVKWK